MKRAAAVVKSSICESSELLFVQTWTSYSVLKFGCLSISGVTVKVLGEPNKTYLYCKTSNRQVSQFRG